MKLYSTYCEHYGITTADKKLQYVFLRAVPVRDDRFQTCAIGGAWLDDGILAHGVDYPARARGSPFPQ